MPYIEYVIKLEYCPDLGKYSDGLTTNEWKALCEYAKQYNISVRPIVNLLGHFDKNSTIKELQKITIKNKDNNYTSVIDPLNPEVRPLINKILDEVVYAFGESIIHVGGDEPCKLSEVYGKEKAYLLIEEMDKALSFMKSLTLKYNIDAFEALILGAKRIKFTAEKLTYLP